MVEAGLATDLSSALATTRAFRATLQRDPGMVGIGPLEGAFDRIRAADILIAEGQQRVRQQIEDGGSPGGILQRHAAMQGLTRERMDRLTGAIADIRKTSEAADQPGLLAALDRFIALLEREQYASADRTPMGATLPYRPLALPQVSPLAGAVIVPAYAQATAVTPLPADLAAAADVPLSGTIAAQVRDLGSNPIAIFEFVQNQIATEFYDGAMKGAQQTLAEKSGNAVDKASLLVALLRASGVPARYVRGVIRLTGEEARRWTATGSVRGAADVFTRAGIPFAPVRQGGTVSALDVAHTWVTAF
ncbi:MAG TPA: transglutaminase-like domain-containing protein, partial [Vicinamibacterales bacterium]